MQNNPLNPATTEAPLLDTTRLDVLTLFGTEAYQELIADVMADVPGQLARIRAAVEDGNLPDLRARAHGCKGMLSNFGCVGMTDRLARFEHEPVPAAGEAATVHTEMEALWTRTLEAIRGWEETVAGFEK